MNKVKLRKIVVIALGGSIVFPEEINWQYLKKFNALIRRHLKGRRFVIVVVEVRLLIKVVLY
jgi:uridylate kinase